MPLKANFTVPNKAIHVFIAIVIVSVLVAGAFAFDDLVLNLAPPAASSIPAVGHSSTEVIVNLGPVAAGNPCSGDVTLQSGLDNDCFKISNPTIPMCNDDETLEAAGGIWQCVPVIPTCADNQILEASGGSWQCVAYTDPPFIPSCADDEILEASGGSWQCVPQATVNEIVCALNEYLAFDGTDWICDPGPAAPCIPSNACVVTTCVGSTCSDSCGNVYNGTSTTGVCCVDSSWSPSPSTVCSGVAFTQTSNCSRTRGAVGTSTAGSCCVDSSWSPSPSTVCSGIPFTQLSNCGNTRSAVGTSTTGACCVADCSCASSNCPGITCSDGCGSTCNGTRTCSSCQETVCVNFSGGICQGSISGGLCCVSGYPVCVINSGGICQGRYAGGYCCVQNCPVCNISTGFCQGRYAGGYCCVFP